MFKYLLSITLFLSSILLSTVSPYVSTASAQTSDTTPPSVSSFVRTPGKTEITNGDGTSLSWRLTFVEDSNTLNGIDPVSNGPAPSFQLRRGTSVISHSSFNISRDSLVYTIEVLGITTSGVYNLQLVADITDDTGNSYTTDLISSESYTVDRNDPSVTSFNRTSGRAQSTNQASISWRLAFNEALGTSNDITVTTGTRGNSDFILTRIRNGNRTNITAQSDFVVSRSGFAYTIEVRNLASGGAADGDYELQLTRDVKDLAGNPYTTNLTSSQIYSVDRTAPTVASFNRTPGRAQSTNQASISWRLAFTEATNVVSGITVSSSNNSDFILRRDGSNVTSTSTIAVSKSGLVYTITVSGLDSNGTDDGDYELQLTKDVMDQLGNAYTTNITSSQTYSVDRTAPTVSSFKRTSGRTQLTNQASIEWKLTFTEATNVLNGITEVNTGTTGNSDFILTRNGSAVTSTSTIAVSRAGLVYTITVSGLATGGSADGDYELQLTRNVSDNFGNSYTTDLTASQPYTVDRTAPTVPSFNRTTGRDELTNQESISWQLTFSEALGTSNDITVVTSTTMGNNDFILTRTRNGTGTNVTAQSDFTVSRAGFVYTITVENLASNGDDDGAYELQLTRDVKDAAGNSYTIDITSGQTYTVDRTAPVLMITRDSPTGNPNTDNTLFTNIDEFVYSISSSEPLSATTDSTNDFALSSDTNKIGTVSGSGNDYTLTYTGVSPASDIQPILLSGNNITDAAGNDATLDTIPTTDSITLDIKAPKFSVIERLTEPGMTPPREKISSNRNIRWRVRIADETATTFADSSFVVGSITRDDFALVDGDNNSVGGTIDVDQSTIAPLDFIVRVTGVPDADDIKLIPRAPNGLTISDFAGNTTTIDSGTDFDGATDDARLFSVDDTDPVVASFVRASSRAESTNQASISWELTFTEASNVLNGITEVNTGTTGNSDFALMRDGSDVTDTSTIAVSRSGLVYTITVSGLATGGADDGDYELQLTRDVTDIAGNAYTTDLTSGEIYSVDRTAPSIASFVRASSRAMVTNQASISWEITFTEASNVVSGITEVMTSTPNNSDFTLTRTRASIDTDVTSQSNFTVIKSGLSYTIEVSGLASDGTDDGDYSLQLTRDINDDFSNAYTTDITSSQTYTVDRVAPTVASFVRTPSRAMLTNQASISWDLTFTEASTTLNGITEVTTSTPNNSDFILTRTRASVGTDITSQSNFTVSRSGLVYTIEVSGLATGGADDGDYSLQLTRDVTDDATNDYTTDLIASDIYTVDRTAPTVASFVRASSRAESTNQASISWELTFTEASTTLNGITEVTSSTLNNSDFVLTRTRSSTDTDVTAVSDFTVNRSGLVYTIEVSDLAADGTDDGVYSLQLTRDVTDDATNAYTTDITSGQTYTVDRTAPSVVSFLRDSSSTTRGGTEFTNAESISWELTFEETSGTLNTIDERTNESVTEFKLFRDGADVTSSFTFNVSRNNLVYTIEALNLDADGSEDGVYTLQLIEDINDGIGNTYTTDLTSVESYTVDRTEPTITINPVRKDNENRSNLDDLSWTITFSEAVLLASSNITPDGFDTNPRTITVVNAANTTERHREWTITFSDDGMVTNLLSDNVIDFTLANIGTITDAATNALESDDLGTRDNYSFKVNGRATTMTITRSLIGGNPRSQHTNSRDVSWFIDFSRDVPADQLSTLTNIFAVSSGVLTISPDTGQADEYILTATGTTQPTTPNQPSVTLSLATVVPIPPETSTVPKFTDARGIAVDDLSLVSFANTQYEFEDTEPVLSTISHQNPMPADSTNIVGPNFSTDPADSTNPADRVVLTWRATFDEPVAFIDQAGITTSNFSVTGPGTSSPPTPKIESVTAAGTPEDLVHPTLGATATFSTQWDITVFNASGDGDTTDASMATTLAMNNGTNIIDRQGDSLTFATPTIPTYFVDNRLPLIEKVERSPSVTDADPTITTSYRDNIAEWYVFFDEPLDPSSIDETDFSTTGATGTIAVTVVDPAPTGYDLDQVWLVTSTITDIHTGTDTDLVLDAVVVTDVLGNTITNTVPTDTIISTIHFDNSHPSIAVASAAPKHGASTQARNFEGNAIFEITVTGDQLRDVDGNLVIDVDGDPVFDIDQTTITPADFVIYEGGTIITETPTIEFITDDTPPVTTNNPISSASTGLTYRVRASGLVVPTTGSARTLTLRSSSVFAIQDTSGNNIVDTAGGTDETGQEVELPGSDTNRIDLLNLPIVVTQTRDSARIFTGTFTDTTNKISWFWTAPDSSNIDVSTIETTDFVISNTMTVDSVELVTDGTNANKQIKITAIGDMEADNIIRNGEGIDVDVHPQISGSFDIRTIYGKQLLGAGNTAAIEQQTMRDHTYLVDTDHPSIMSVNRLRSSTDLTNFNTSGTTSALGVSWLVTFDDPVTDFDTADVTITGFVDSTGADLTVAPANLSVTSDGAVTNNGITSAQRWVISITDTTDFVLPNPDPSRPAVANKSGNITFTLGTSFTDVNNNAYLEAATPSSTDYQFLVNIGEPILMLTLDTTTPNTATEAVWTLDFGEQVLISSVTLADFSTTSGTLAIEPNPSTTDPVAQSYKITVSGITNDPDADVPVQLGLNTNAGFTDNRIPTRNLVYSTFATALDFTNNNKIYISDNHAPTIESVVRQNPTDTNFNIASGNTVTWRVTFDEEMDENSIGTDDFEIVAAGITATITGADRDGTSNSWNITATLSDQTAPTATNVSLSLNSTFAIVDDAGNALASDTASFTSAVYSVDIHRPLISKVERAPTLNAEDPTTNISRDNILEWYVFFDEPIDPATIDGTDFSTSGATGSTITATAVDPASDPTNLSNYVLNQVWHIIIDDTSITNPHEGTDTELVLDNVTVEDMRDNALDITMPPITPINASVSTIKFDNTHPTISVTSVSPALNYLGTTEFKVTISGTVLAGITDLDLSTITNADFALADNSGIITDGSVSIDTPTPASGNLVYTVTFTGLTVPADVERVLQLHPSASFAMADTSGNVISTDTADATPLSLNAILPNAANNDLRLFNPDVDFTQTIPDPANRVFINDGDVITWTWELSETDILNPTNSSDVGYISADDFTISNGMTVDSAELVGGTANQILITATVDDTTPSDNDDVRPIRSAAFDLTTIYLRPLTSITVNNDNTDDTTYTVDTIRPVVTEIIRVTEPTVNGNEVTNPAAFLQVLHWRITFDDEVQGLEKSDISLEIRSTDGNPTQTVSSSSSIYEVVRENSSAALDDVWYVTLTNTDTPGSVPHAISGVLSGDVLTLPDNGRDKADGSAGEANTAGTIVFTSLVAGAVQDHNLGGSLASTVPLADYQYNVDTSVVTASLALDTVSPNRNPSNSASAKWNLTFTGPVVVSSVTRDDFVTSDGTIAPIVATNASGGNATAFEITVNNITDSGTSDTNVQLGLNTVTSQFMDTRPPNGTTVDFADSSLTFSASSNIYVRDTHPPEILSVVRMDPSTQNIIADPSGSKSVEVEWRVTFSETMDPTTITLASFGVATGNSELTGTVDSVTPAGTNVWDVVVDLTDARTTAEPTMVTLTADATMITDDASNTLNGTDSTPRRTADTAIYMADLVAPRLDKIERPPGVPERTNELRWYIYLNEPIRPGSIDDSHFSRTGVTITTDPTTTLSIDPLTPEQISRLQPPNNNYVLNQVFEAEVDVGGIPERRYNGVLTTLTPKMDALVLVDVAGNQLSEQTSLQNINQAINFDNDSPPLEVVSVSPERNYQGNTTFTIQIREIAELNESTIDSTDFALAMSDGTLLTQRQGPTITLGAPDRATPDTLIYEVSVSGVSVNENLQTLHLAASAAFNIADNSGNPLFLTPEGLIRQVGSPPDPVRVMFRNDNLSLAQTRDSLPRLFSADSGNLVWLINMTGLDEIDNPTSGAGQIETTDFVASNGFAITDAQLTSSNQITVTAQHDGSVHNGGDSNLHSGNDDTHFNVHITRSSTFDLRSNFLQPLPTTISFDPAVDNTYVVDNDRPNIETFVRNGTYRQGNTDSLSWTITFDQPVSTSSVTDNNDFAVSGYVPSTTPVPMAEALDDQNGFASEFRITVMGGDLMDAVPPSQDPDSIEPEGPITISYSSPSITDMNGLSVDTTLPSSATTDPDPTNDAIGPPVTYYVDQNIASLASFTRPSSYTATDGSTVRITPTGVTASREWRWEAMFTKAIVPSSLSTEDFEITDGEILSVYPSDIDNLSFTIIARYDGDDNVAIQISPTRNAQYTDNERNQVVDIDLQAFHATSVYELDITPPTITSLSRDGSSRVRQGNISWTITFDSPVVENMIDNNTFAIDNDDNFTTTTSRVSPSAYRVELTSNLSGLSDRELRLSLVEPSDIIDLSGNVYIPTNFASFSRSSVYLLDTTDPTVESLYRIVDGARVTADPHISDSYYLTWAIEFSEPITNFDASDLNLTGSTNTLEISLLGNTAIVRIPADPAPTGEVTLSFSNNFNIADIAGNIATVTRGATIDTGSYTVDRTDPTVRVLSVRNASRTGRVADAGDLVEVTIAIVGEPSPLIVPPMLTLLGSTIRPLQFTSSFGNTYTTSFRVNSATPEGHLFFTVSGGSDRAGNTVSPVHFVSDSNSGNEFTITLRTPPVVESIRRSLPVSGPISAESLTWLVEFSESVSNVASSDFQLERDGNAVTSIGNLRIEGAPNTAAYLVILDNIPSNLSAELGLSMSSSTGIVDISGVSLSSASPRISETYILRTLSSGLADAIPRLVVTVDKGGSAGFRQASPPIGVFPDTAPTMANMNEMITVTVTSTLPLSDSTLLITLSGSPLTLTPNADRTIYSHTFPVTRDVPTYDGPIDIMIDGSDYESAGGVEGQTLEVRSTVNSDNPNALGRPVGALTIQRPVRVLSHRRSLSGNEVTPGQNVLWDVSFSSEVNNIDGSDYCVVTNSNPNACTEYRVNSRVSRRASEAGSRYVYRVTASSPRVMLPIGTEVSLMLRSTHNIEDATTRNPLPNPTLTGNENQSYELAATSNVTDASGLSHTRRLVQNFIAGRAKRILSSSPKLSDRFRPRRTGIAESWYSANFTDTTTEISYSGETDFGYTYSSLNQPILRGWIDTIYISSVDDDDKDESLMVHAGIDSHTSPNSIIGLLLQYDSTDRDFTDPIFGSQDGSNIKGDGWLVGPYHTISFGNSSTLESRVSYGRSKNSISPTGTYTDIFNTERYLGSIKYSGNLESGNLRVSPDLNYLYYLEKQLSYTDGLSATILPQDFHTHRLEFGPSFEHRYGYLLGDSIYTPYFSLYGIWDFEITELDGTQEAPVTDITGRIDGGLRFTGLSGTDLDISGYYDGIGTELESYGVSFGIVINY